MKPQNATTITFISYVLATVCFTFLYFLLPGEVEISFTPESKAPPASVLLQDLAKGLAAELGLWFRYIAISLVLNFLFFVALKFAIGLSIRRLLLYSLVTFLLAFILYVLIYSILQWIFGLYFSTTISQVLVTYFVLKWERLF